MQQGSAAAAAMYDHRPGSAASGSSGADAGDAVMARWLQSAGLQHLGSPLASADHRTLPNLLIQGYGAQSAEEKKKFFRLMRNLNFNGESGSEPYTPTSQSFGAVGAADGFYLPDLRGEFGAGLLDLHSVDDTELLSDGYGAQSAEEKKKFFRLMRNLNLNGESGSEPYTPTSQSFGAVGAADGFYLLDLRGEFGAGLLDLHSVDDTELLSEHVMSEPFEPSPFMPDRGFENDFGVISSRQQGPADSNLGAAANEKESSAKESNVAKIKVVVRKRPLNKKEMSRKEDDIVTVHNNAYLSVHEPKLKV